MDEVSSLITDIKHGFLTILVSGIYVFIYTYIPIIQKGAFSAESHCSTVQTPSPSNHRESMCTPILLLMVFPRSKQMLFFTPSTF